MPARLNFVSKLALSLETKHLLKTPLSREKLEQDLLNEVCIPSMLARLDLLQKGYKQ